jgi:Uma2 family endonuclease
MLRQPVRTQMAPEEYLAWEQDQPTKHEYFGGVVYDMAGGTPRHNALCGAMIGELRSAHRERDCHVLTSDQRVGRTGKHYVYPDVTVVCGPVEKRPHAVVDDATILVEVLSEATEREDRGDKWEIYRRLPSLTDYLLVAQDRAIVEHFQRDGRGTWTYRDWRAGDTITLANGAIVVVDDVYRGVFELPGEATRDPESR